MRVACKGWGSVKLNAMKKEGLLNIEPVICNGHLLSPWGWCRRGVGGGG